MGNKVDKNPATLSDAVFLSFSKNGRDGVFKHPRRAKISYDDIVNNFKIGNVVITFQKMFYSYSQNDLAT